MASGQITVLTESVDWPNYTRGACTLTNIIGWSVDNSGKISFHSIDSSDNVGGTWWVCTTSVLPNEGYVIMEVQVNYGGGWQTVTSSSVKRAVCNQGQTNAIEASLTCISNLGTPTLTANCTMRILYYADLNPHPSSDLKNAFPSESYSAEVQVPVDVTVDYRPGEVLTSGTWKSTNRSGGKCQILNSGTWTEMKTADGGTGTGNPPSIRKSGSWKNQSLIGSQS